MKEKIIIHGNIHDSINYKALIEAQASNVNFEKTNDKKNSEERSKAKKLTKCYIRGKLKK